MDLPLYRNSDGRVHHSRLRKANGNARRTDARRDTRANSAYPDPCSPTDTRPNSGAHPRTHARANSCAHPRTATPGPRTCPYPNAHPGTYPGSSSHPHAGPNPGAHA